MFVTTQGTTNKNQNEEKTAKRIVFKKEASKFDETAKRRQRGSKNVKLVHARKEKKNTHIQFDQTA